MKARTDWRSERRNGLVMKECTRTINKSSAMGDSDLSPPPYRPRTTWWDGPSSSHWTSFLQSSPLAISRGAQRCTSPAAILRGPHDRHQRYSSLARFIGVLPATWTTAKDLTGPKDQAAAMARVSASLKEQVFRLSTSSLRLKLIFNTSAASDTPYHRVSPFSNP